METESENIDIDDTGQDALPRPAAERLSVCYCNGKVDFSMLKCCVCKTLFHASCLKNGRPSNLKGDVYFDYTCAKCSEDGHEKCYRKQLNWLQVVYLALYNLICNGSGRRGYFRWKDDLCQFIDANWTTFHGERKRTSSWFSTVAGILSSNCPRYFRNGQKQFREGGWWTLQEVIPPSERVELVGGGMSSRRKKKGVNVPAGEAATKTRSSERKRKLDEMEMVEENETVKTEQMEDDIVNVKEGLTEVDDVDALEGFLENSAELLELDIGDFGPMDGIFDELDGASSTSLSSSFAEANISEKSETKISEKSETKSENSSPVEPNVKPESVIVLDPEEINRVQSEGNGTEPCKRSREANEQVAPQAQRLRAMHPHEERTFLEKLNKLNSQNTSARRLRRKLVLRQWKQQCGLPVFDLDCFIKRTLTTVSHYIVKDNEVVPVMLETSETVSEKPKFSKKPQRTFRMIGDRILDRFMALPQQIAYQSVKQVNFLSRLIGSDHMMLTRNITSPYTSRILKPFIRRDFETMPLKVKLLKEICQRYRNVGPDPDWERPDFGSIDYCYVQPHHIPGVNVLCREFFWPGIDLSECLQYPDFSCVALYKKLIIGCAFMVPDVKCNEAYISFIVVHPDWRRAGIGSFMIYHLIQTCLGKDVTLHVSVNNPAMLMYQKFGFKPERFVVDFYDRYLSPERQECKHAFFLRLQR